MALLRLLLGRPLASEENAQTRLGVTAGVAAMGLDGLSSAAYGPEAAMTMLMTAGLAGLHVLFPVMLAILVLLALLYFSYRQTIAAYPQNGGSYTVARENIGPWAGLLAAAALMIDYVLTVAVGISAGIAALVSAAPHLHPYTLPMCLGVLGLLTLLNLRGTAEAGIVLAAPTYLFVGSLGIVLGLGLIKTIAAGGHPVPAIAPPAVPAASEAVGLWLILRAFASGCTAMTGVEAVSNGVSAFKEPTVKHAHRTLTCIVAILAALLGIIALLCRAYQIPAMDQSRPGYQSVLSQLTAAVVGRHLFYYITSGAVLAVLCLSANTSFVDFPRLCRLVARDRFLPAAFAELGRRLVYSAGILVLAASAAALLILFRGITDKLIPLYAVGAFLAFTLSQTGMVLHWSRNQKRSIAKASINAVGAVATAGALAIILVAKFVEGAWLTILAIPLLLFIFRQVNRHYQRVDREVEAHGPLDCTTDRPPSVLVPMKGYNRMAAKALRFALTISDDVTAVHLSDLDGEKADQEADLLRQKWAADVEAPASAAHETPPKLITISSPYRDFIGPMMTQIEKKELECPHQLIGVIVPQIVSKHWLETFLHRRKARALIKAILHRREHRVIVIGLPWYLND